MTNSEAFLTVYNGGGENLSTLILTNAGITPSGTSDNELSTAYAMMERIKAGDVKRGSTSFTLTPTASRELKIQANFIFDKYDVVYESGLPAIDSQGDW